MAAPYWVSVAVLVLMTVRNGETVIDQNQLEPIVQDILNRYTPEYIGAKGKRKFPMFSVAVSVPYNEQTNMYDMRKVTDDDGGEEVKKDILNCDVYIGNRVVAATVLKWPNVFYQCPNKLVDWPVPKKCKGKEIKTWADIDKFCDKKYIKKNLNPQAVHAESRTLDYFKENDKIRKNSKDDLMVFYVRASPCDQTCTNPGNGRNILTDIKNIKKWKNYVVVFSDVFRPRNGKPIPKNNLRGSLERLAYAIAEEGTKKEDKISNGLQHIFRCYRQPEIKCYSCNFNGGVKDQCVSYGKQPDSKLSDVGKSQERGKRQNRSKKKQKGKRQRGGVMRENHQN